MVANQYGAASASQVGSGIIEDANANMIVSGGIGISNTSNELYVTKTSSGGGTLWSPTFAISVPNGFANAPFLSFSETGTPIVAGTFCGTITLEADHAGPACSTQSPRDATFITMLRNDNGAPISSTIFVQDARIHGFAKAATDGRTFAAGQFSGSVTFPTQLLTGPTQLGSRNGWVIGSAP